MLDKKFGMKYSFPHSVIHIVDNSMNREQLPVTIVDDPSLYASIVVTGAPMGKDNTMVNINRSDILNVAYGLGNLTASDINKYGQTVTYPSSLIAQNAPIRLMRVTPEDATYAFSCLLVQWKWQGNKMQVRFKTSDELGNNGLPLGLVLSGFKNPQKLNAALVRGFKQDPADNSEGWTQRVFMTYISAGRGKVYNNFNYAINSTNQERRPANVRYLFTTIDTRTDATVEKFFASLINRNATSSNATPTVNVQVAARADGSDILIPTVNESAIDELYNEYTAHMRDMIDQGILPEGVDSMKWVERVSALLSINTFDPLFGHYIYDGESDINLPYYQVDMFNLDIPQLDTANRIQYVLNSDQTISDVTAEPDPLVSILDTKTIGLIGVPTTNDNYRIGDIFLSKGYSLALNMIIAINQYSGAVTSIPITQVYTDASKLSTDVFRYNVSVVNATDAEQAITVAIANKKLIPRVVNTTPKTYKPDFVLVGLGSTTAPTSWCIAKVEYGEGDTPTVTTVTVYDAKADIYKMLYYPGTAVAYFTTDAKSEAALSKAGTTIIDVTDHAASGSEEAYTASGNVYVNGYYPKGESDVFDTDSRYLIESTNPFRIGNVPTSLAKSSSIIDQSYDLMLYQDNGSEFLYSVTSGTADPTSEITGEYVTGDIVALDAVDDTPIVQNVQFSVTKTASGPSVYLYRSDIGNDPIPVGTYTTKPCYILLTAEPADWASNYQNYYTKNGDQYDNIPAGEAAPEFVADTYYKISTTAGGLKIIINESDIRIDTNGLDPDYIQRYVVTGTQGSIYRYAQDPRVIPNNYYSPDYGTNPSSELGGIAVKNGYAGFFDDNISDIEFKWKYSALLVRAYKGELDPRIKSPQRCPAKFLFDGGTNTVLGQNILPYMTNIPAIDVITASTIFTDDEKEAAVIDQTLLANLDPGTDVDVKQAMYDLCIERCYDRIPEDKRPIGPGSGLSLHLDGGISDADTMLLINNSFGKRFANPNVSWDIGGYTSALDGVTYTYQKWIVDNLFTHMSRESVNKPFVGKYSNIGPNQYTSFFPDIDATEWELRELYYKSGGNAWVMDINGNLQRKSQRTLYRDADTSDLIQESNMRTLSQLCHLLKNKIDSYLFEYSDDGVLKTLHDEVMNMFSNWVGNLVDELDIVFERDTDPNDGGDLVVCYVKVVFRGLILRVPIIVNVERRTNYVNNNNT